MLERRYTASTTHAPAAPTPMPSRRARISLGLLGAAALGGLAVWQLGPGLLEDTVRDRALAELHARGIDATIGDLDLTATTAILRDVCVMHLPPAQDSQLACVDLVRVGYTRDGLLSTDVEPTSIDVEGGFVDLSAEHGSIDELVARYRDFATSLTGDDEEGSGEGSGDHRGGPRGPGLPVHVGGIDVRLTGQPIPLDGVTVASVDLGGEREDVTIVLDPRGERLPPFLDAQLPDTWSIVVTPADDLPAVSITPSSAVDIALPAPLDGARLRVGGLAFTPPYTFRAEQVALSDPRGRLDVSFDRASVELRQLATSLDDLFLASMAVDGLRLEAALTDDLRPVLLASDAPTADEEPGETEPTAADEPTRAATGGLWDDRVWWEKIPQHIDIRGAEIGVHRASDPTQRIGLTGLDLTYALRVFHFQLDVMLDGALRGADGDIGNAHVELRWNWDRGRMFLDTDLQVDDLPAIERFVRGTDPWLTSGALQLNARFREAERGPGLSFSGTSALTDLSLTLPADAAGRRLLDAPLAFGRFAYTWAATRDRDEDNVLKLTFTQGDGELDGARFVFLPVLYDFWWDRNPFTTGGRIRTEVPVQPIGTLWAAIPDALLGSLVDAQMSGEWGFENEFAFAFEPDEDDPDGRRHLRIEAPDVHIVHDANLDLVSLPDPLDVRRMLDAFSFVWQGPEGTEPRTFQVPAPGPPGVERPSDDDAGDAGETGALDDPQWARLDEISPWLATVHLYREDGSFFRNHGFNWYQVRRVAEEMWWERQTGRGASTVSMQLVKNVFLTHERTLSRKVQEMFLTWWMTRLVEKERILEIYFNVIEWGPGINGIVEAADHYFGALPSELTLAESAWLSAIVPAPITRSQQRLAGTPPEYMQRRVHEIIDGLRSRDLITDADQLKGHAQQVLFVTHEAWAEAWPDRAARRFGTAFDALPAMEQTTAGGP